MDLVLERRPLSSPLRRSGLSRYAAETLVFSSFKGKKKIQVTSVDRSLHIKTLPLTDSVTFSGLQMGFAEINFYCDASVDERIFPDSRGSSAI